MFLNTLGNFGEKFPGKKKSNFSKIQNSINKQKSVKRESEGEDRGKKN